MNSRSIPKATLGRLPLYLRFLESKRAESKTISATAIAKELGLGDVQVRKDLGAVSGFGKPKVGYNTDDLINQLEGCLGQNNLCKAVIVGAGKLGRALLDYNGFEEYGLEIAAAFDTDTSKLESQSGSKPIYPMSDFENFCFREGIKIGIITVPQSAAQSVCDLMAKCNISAIWSFAPIALRAPDGIVLRQENLALSLAHLNKQV